MNNRELRDNHYKACSPEETVLKLKDILEKNNIKVEEKVNHESSIKTNSLRVVFRNTDIGTNGKGINESYAKASAYAEFFERMENQHLNSFAKMSDDNSLGFYLFADEKIMELDELISQNDAFLSFYFRTSRISQTEFLRRHKIDSIKTGIANTYISVPFYDYYDDKIVYLPYNVYRPWYGSNGMCAGNTPAEALVQGMAELFERIVMKKIFENPIAMPDVPDEYMKKYPYICERFQIIKSNDNFFVRMLDCSLGGEFPVAGLLLIEKNTGNYGLKLGCHPDFGIAMERTMTESSQGQDVFEFVNSSYLDFSNENVFSEINLAHCYMTGEGQYPYQIFSRKSQFCFCEPEDVSDKTNEQLLQRMIDKIQSMGYHVLIRDVSYMQFPAFHIIIPGLSETGVATEEDYEMIQKLNDTMSVFRNPKQVNADNVDSIMAVLNHFSYQKYFSFFMNTENVEVIPWENIGESVHFYQASLEIARGNYSEAIVYLTMISQKMVELQCMDESSEWLLALIYYLSARQEIDSFETIMLHMNEFFDNQLCSRLEDLFSQETDEAFNSNLFCKMVCTYQKNDIDLFVCEMMNNSKKSMIGNMPMQGRLI